MVDPASDQPSSRFAPGSSVQLDDGTTLTVSRFEATERSPVVTFSEISDRLQAEGLRGRDLFIDVGERRPLGEEEFWPDELVGMEVVDPAGDQIGVVSAVESGAAQDRLVIETPHGSMTVPFVSGLVIEVDGVTRRMVADLPEGLTD